MFPLYFSDSLCRALQNLHDSTPGARASVIADTDGLLVMSYPPERDGSSDPASSESVAAISAVLLGLAERTLARLAQGELERVMIEGGAGVVVVVPASPDAALAVLVDKNAKLGLTLRAIGQCAEGLKEIFAR